MAYKQLNRHAQPPTGLHTARPSSKARSLQARQAVSNSSGRPVTCGIVRRHTHTSSYHPATPPAMCCVWLSEPSTVGALQQTQTQKHAFHTLMVEGWQGRTEGPQTQRQHVCRIAQPHQRAVRRCQAPTATSEHAPWETNRRITTTRIRSPHIAHLPAPGRQLHEPTWCMCHSLQAGT
jgi:hypothetical protein